MNCIPACKPGLRVLTAVALLATIAAPSFVAAAATDRRYHIDFVVTPYPDSGRAGVEMQVRQDRHLLREVAFSADRLADIDGDAELEVRDGEVVWRPSAGKSKLRWTVDIANRRGRAVDAYLDPAGGIFRAEDLIPRARARTLVGAESITTLRFKLPASWSAIASLPERDGVIRIDRPNRRFDLPTGWIAVGALGVRTDQVGETRVVVAGPVNQGVRRLDMLALLRWTLPELQRILPTALKRLTVISGGDPMWRGGLSAPTSLFVHAELPLISENATSLLLHEVMHVVMDMGIADGHDWIQEGLAEYYGMELLRRSGSISNSRFRDAIAAADKWGREADTLCGENASGPMTAAAVSLLHDLDEELEAAGSTIDELFRRLLSSGNPVDTSRLIALSDQLLPSPSAALRNRKLDDCR